MGSANVSLINKTPCVHGMILQRCGALRDAEKLDAKAMDKPGISNMHKIDDVMSQN